MPSTIYVLGCPVSGRIRYIGKTNIDLDMRLRQHTYEATRTKCHRARWINKLASDGAKPTIKAIYRCSGEFDWMTLERFFIASGRYIGLSLVNATAGGEGLVNPSEDVRARMSSSRKTLMQNQSVRDHCSKKQSELWTNPEYRLRQSNTRRQLADTFKEHLLRASAKAKEKLSDPAAAAALAAKRREIWADENYKIKMAAVRRLYKQKMLDNMAAALADPIKRAARLQKRRLGLLLKLEARGNKVV